MILNYTTKVSVEKTATEIMQYLVKHGARSASLESDGNGNVTGVAFLFRTSAGEYPFRMVPRIDGVYKVLEEAYKKRIVQGRFVTEEQAGRVAWRNLKALIEAQIAAIECEIVSFDELFLGQLVVGDRGQTLHQLFVAKQLPMLPAPRG